MAKTTYAQLKDELKLRGLPRLLPPYNPDPAFSERVQSLPPGELFDHPVTKPDFVSATAAGLLLWADCLDDSHHISQEVGSATGSYWHGLMHRREPDYGNSLYWFRRTGDHPAFPLIHHRVIEELAKDGSEESRALADTVRAWSRWIPESFVALCENAGHMTHHDIRALEIAQLVEMETLLDWTHAQATCKDGESGASISY